MPDTLAALFDRFDRGRLSRRQLLKALGAAVAARPASSFAQGQCGGARAGTPECDPTPAKLPFEPTGWKTVLLDHFSCQVADYPKEAAYYAALMNWKIRSDDGKQAVLDIGDWGGLVLRGGYQAPPAPPAAPAPPAGDAGGRRPRRRPRRRSARAAQRGVRRLLLGHRAVGREEGRSRAAEARAHAGRRQPRQGLPELPREGSGRLRPADQQRQPEEPPPGTRERQDVGAGAVRADQLEDRLARSHLVRGRRTTRRPSRSTRRCSAGSRGRTRAARTSARSATSATSSSAAAAAATAAAARARPPARRAAMGHISFGITAVRSGSGEGRARQARADRARRHRRPGRHPHRRRTRAITRRRRTDSICRSARRRERIGRAERAITGTPTPSRPGGRKTGTDPFAGTSSRRIWDTAWRAQSSCRRPGRLEGRSRRFSPSIDLR